jgi:hypothetical protein
MNMDDETLQEWALLPEPPEELTQDLSEAERDSFAHIWVMAEGYPELRVVLASLPPAIVPSLCDTLEHVGRSMMELFRSTIRSFAPMAIAVHEAQQSALEKVAPIPPRRRATRHSSNLFLSRRF